MKSEIQIRSSFLHYRHQRY